MGNHWRPIGDGVWVGEYSFHDNTIHMLVTELGPGRLAVFSPGPGASDAAFAELDGLGQVVALVSPGAFHNEGLPVWHKRYPAAQLYATRSGVARIAKLYKSLPACKLASELAATGGDLSIYETPGKHGDLLVFIKRGETTILFSCEYLVNWADAPTKLLFRLLFKWTQSVPGLRMAKPAAWFLSADLKEVARFCSEKIEAHGVDHFVPCHGDVVTAPNVKAQLEQAIRARL